MRLFADKDDCTLLVLDLQERLFPHIRCGSEIFNRISLAVHAATAFKIPVIVTQQNPADLGPLITDLKQMLSHDQKIVTKTAFSVFYNATDLLESRKTWILTGVETHICILQTAKDLIAAQQDVILLKDATSSCRETDFLTATAEMRDLGCRITQTETLIFEWVRDAKNPLFKSILSLVKTHA